MTAPLTPQEQTYQALRRAMLRAQDAGVRIVCEAFRVWHGHPGVPARLVGCCALTALALHDRAANRDVKNEARRLIVRGFDGVPLALDIAPPESHERAWYEVGARLRDEFRPTPAIVLERELEGV